MVKTGLSWNLEKGYLSRRTLIVEGIMNLNELKYRSICLTEEPIEAYYRDDMIRILGRVAGVAELNGFPSGFPTHMLDYTHYYMGKSKVWNANNSVLAYVDEDSNAFITWITHTTLKILRENGYERDNSLYVPFSTGLDIPTRLNGVSWEKWHEEANKEWEREEKEDCIAYCKKQRLGGELPMTILNRCFAMPKEGMTVRAYGENTYYTPCVWGGVHAGTIDKLGCYNTNNGVVTFVYHDGTQYVASHSVLDALCAAGYRESTLFVPFSNGDYPVDDRLRAQLRFALSA